MTYKETARESRLKVLDLVHKAGTSHIGSLLGAADIFAVLFEKFDFEKDVFVLGKSWAAALLYFHLWKRGRITQEQLDSYCQEGSKFIGLAEPFGDKIFPFGIGSMGMGLPAAVGFALSKKRRGEAGRVYCLMSDGEMNVGTTWESALIAAMHKLDNLYVIVDVNGLQAMGKTEEILNVDPLWEKWEAFGWIAYECSGHNYADTETCLAAEKKGLPQVLLANTTKGKGVSFMEDRNVWHYAQVKDDDYKKAKKELCQKS